jgi:hypothetical protein
MNRATEPSPHVYGRAANTSNVNAVTQAYAAANTADVRRGGGGRCSTASANGAVKYL